MGTALTPAHVTSLLRHGYATVMVENELLPGIEVPEVVCEETRAKTLQSLSDAVQRIHLGREIEARPLQRAVESILEEVTENMDLAFSLSVVRGADEYTFHHSLDVCVYAILLGRARGYSFDDLLRLGVGALLHDLGKVQMVDLVQKKGSLTAEEWERMKEHPRIGYDLLRANFEISLLSAHVAFQHHEKWDGTGYPRGLQGAGIHEFGLIAAVADIWSALTADRPYRFGLDPLEAAEQLLGMAGKHLEAGLVNNLLSRVARYPTGSIVLLEDLRVGVVTAQEAESPERPQVTIVANRNGILARYQNLMLVEQPDVRIKRILPDWPKVIRDQISSSAADIARAQSAGL